jgi:hypothetical protein
MLRTVVELKKKLKALLDSGPCPTLAIFMKYNFMGPGVGVHVADACTILNAVTHNAHPLPKEGDYAHQPEHFTIQRLRTVLCFGHMFHAMCMAFLLRYFKNDWIVCILTWIEFAKINIPPTPNWEEFEHQSEENWLSIAHKVVAAVRHPDMRTNVPIERSFVNVDTLSDLHQ